MPLYAGVERRACQRYRRFGGKILEQKRERILDQKTRSRPDPWASSRGGYELINLGGIAVCRSFSASEVL
jgi:hypothetical protein